MIESGNAIVTGGASGIGRAFCRELAQRGWSVAVADIHQQAAEEVATEIDRGGGFAVGLPLDVTSPESWIALRDQLKPSWRKLDLLVNCAGVLATGTLAETSPEELRRVVDVNLIGTMLGCRTIGPWLTQNQSTAAPRGVINTASIFAAIAPPGFAAYNATKAGVLALTESLRGEIAPLGYNATAVLPGVTPTKLFDAAHHAQPLYADLCQQFAAQSKITADQVAQQALDGAARGRLYVVVGGRAKWYWRIKRLAPQWLMNQIGRRAARELQLDSRSAVHHSPQPNRT